MYRLYIRLGLPSDHLCMISALALLSDIRILVMTWTLRIFLRYVPIALGLGNSYILGKFNSSHLRSKGTAVV